MINVDPNITFDLPDEICTRCNKIIKKAVYYDLGIAYCEKCYFKLNTYEGDRLNKIKDSKEAI